MLGKRIKITGLAIAIGYLLISCGGLSTKQKTAASDALKSMNKISAATEVGVNYPQYGQMVIEAKAQVNEAVAVLPDGNLKKELNAAMDAYADSMKIWQHKLNNRSLFSDEPDSYTLIQKYSLKTTSFQFQGRPIDAADPAQALQTVWGTARTHLDKASKMLNK
jgi:hypothetical protein